MKMKIKNLLLYSLLTVITISSAASIVNTLAAFIESKTIDSSATPFMDETSNELICYPLSGDGTSVAVGWGKKPNEATGSYIVPTYVSDGTNSYTVKAIIKSGFRYCGFTSVTFEGDTVEEIQAEAFYSCQNLTTFTYPKKCVNGVGPSAFMDCRNLTKVDMTATATYVKANLTTPDFLSTYRFVIGDHAFASCVKLKGFTFPVNLKEIGVSAFNNCKGISGIFLPVEDDGALTDIRIEKYAFSDCTNFAIMHFGTNIAYIDSYAFAQCDKLRIYYGGSSDPAGFDEYFRKKHVATNKTNLVTDYVPIEYNISDMTVDDDHPGLIYTRQPGPILYDGKDNSTLVLDSSTDDYITIFQWQTPTVPSGDYDAVNDVLTIPDEIDGCPVKRILKHAFSNTYNQTVEEGFKPLKGIVFNESLVQIQREAFKGCSELASINFDNCITLREIGNNAFEVSNGGKNTHVTSISLPNCLYYIGQAAFKNFTKVTSLSLFDQLETPYLKIIGSSAFYALGSDVDDSYKGQLDLVLPYSLQDGATVNTAPIGAPSYNRCVGNSAFAKCPLIKYVTVQYTANNPSNANTAYNNAGNIRMGFGDKCFSECSYLLRFKANKAMFWLGSAMFEKCYRLKELFLSTYTTTKITDRSTNDLFLWGCGEGNSIFFEGDDTDDTEFRDLVIYIDGSRGPARRARQEKYYVWNSDPKTYADEYANSGNTTVYAPYLNRTNADSDFRKDTVIGRSIVPTYYNVDYHTAGTVKYVNVDNGAASNDFDYTNSVACFVSDNKYIMTKCYAHGKSSIDMSGWSLGKNIDAIGPSAFSTLNAGNTTQKIVLPSTVTKIRERAFYSVGTDGIDVVTYKKNESEVTDSGASPATKYCFLPESLTRLENFSFYNNDFTKVELPNSLTYFGNTVFNVSRSKEAAITSFSIATGGTPPFTMTSDGLGMYDTSSGTLLYYAPKGAPGSLALDLSGESLNAIGARALANTNYTSIKLPTSVTTIYGAAFGGNSAITAVTNFSGLKYIASSPDSSDTDVWNYDANFDVANQSAKNSSKDARIVNSYPNPIGYAGYEQGGSTNNYANRVDYANWYAKFGAFANCTSLTTFDFGTCSSTLKKIGYGAFENCSSLANMTDGTVTYAYYHYYSGLTENTAVGDIDGDDSNKEELTSKVLDLSGFSNLKNIDRGAFRDCTNVKYAHLPLVYSQDVSKASQASFHLGYDRDDKASWYIFSSKVSGNEYVFQNAGTNDDGAVLVGETATFANPSGGNYATETFKNTSSTSSNPPFNIDEWDHTKYEITRYPVFALKPANTYYYVRDKSNFSNDTLSNVGGKIVKYWIELDGDATHKNYLLFEGIDEIRAYYGL